MIEIDGSRLPEHVSYSSLTTWLDCGWKYYLSRVEEIQEVPSWYLLGGTTLHKATELYDLHGSDDIEKLWEKCWKETIDETLKNTTTTMDKWKAGGRPSKTYPNKEDDKWWSKNGPKQLEKWVQFRSGSWSILDIDGSPAVELDIQPVIAGVPVKMQIDRVMVTPDGEVVVVDIKSGRSIPTWLQLAFYAAGLEKTYGIKPQWGTYWMSRSGITSAFVNLDEFPTGGIEFLVAQFDKARRNDVFLPNLSHCSKCGLSDKCKWK